MHVSERGFRHVISVVNKINRLVAKKLRQNPRENRAISGFSGQKSGTRIILSILQSFFFLHVLKAKYTNNCIK